MVRRQALAAAGAAALSLAAGRSFAAEPDVIDYAVDLRLDREAAVVYGTERIRVRATQALDALVFPRNGIQVTAVRLDGGPVDHWVTADTIELRLPTPLAPGRTATIDLAYAARSPRGVTFRPDEIHTAFFTCHWMVCREDPDDRAAFTLTLTVPEEFAVVASGTPGPRQPVAGGMVRQVWRERRPYPAYLFGFAAGRYARASERHRGTVLEVHAANLDPVGRARMLADTAAMLAFFERKAGLPLPRPFYRQVVVGGDQAQEATSFSLLGRQQIDQFLASPEEDWAIAHELAHQFWGNLVTCADWTEFWLNEGLTVFMVAAWKQQRWGPGAYQRELQLARDRHQVAVAAGFDVPLTFPGRYPSLRLRRAVVYSKGALFLAALREAMGEGPFWAALGKYTRRFAGKSVTSADFQRVFAGETTRDLGPLFQTWVY